MLANSSAPWIASSWGQSTSKILVGSPVTSNQRPHTQDGQADVWRCSNQIVSGRSPIQFWLKQIGSYERQGASGTDGPRCSNGDIWNLWTQSPQLAFVLASFSNSLSPGGGTDGPSSPSCHPNNLATPTKRRTSVSHLFLGPILIGSVWGTCRLRTSSTDSDWSDLSCEPSPGVEGGTRGPVGWE